MKEYVKHLLALCGHSTFPELPEVPGWARAFVIVRSYFGVARSVKVRGVTAILVGLGRVWRFVRLVQVKGTGKAGRLFCTGGTLGTSPTSVTGSQGG